MANNRIDFPLMNPVKVFDIDQTSLAKFFTKHFDDHQFSDRLHPWQQPEDFKQIWQKDDIIYFQFESTFDPIVAQLIDKNGRIFIELTALNKLPHRSIPGLYSFEIAMSLATITSSGCYQIKIIAGSSGPTQKTFKSAFMYISTEQIENSMLIEYFNSRFHGDVMFETGIKFQYRVHGHFGFLVPGFKNEIYNNQKRDPTILNSITSRQWPVYFGDEFGLPDDVVDLLNRIWSCDNVAIDDKLFCVVDGSGFEFIPVERYPKRGVRLNVLEGINRNSKIFALNLDTTKKIIMNVMVDPAVWGDTANQGSGNTVPFINVLAND